MYYQDYLSGISQSMNESHGFESLNRVERRSEIPKWLTFDEVTPKHCRIDWAVDPDQSVKPMANSGEPYFVASVRRRAESGVTLQTKTYIVTYPDGSQRSFRGAREVMAEFKVSYSTFKSRRSQGWIKPGYKIIVEQGEF